MRKAVAIVLALGVLGATSPSVAAAKAATVVRLESIETVLAVAMPADFPVASLMRAHCSSLLRIERPDGSATEIEECQLSDEPVMVPEFQGVAPRSAFKLNGASCMWFSDYWGATAGVPVLAESFRYTVTPSGHVHVRSDYPAQPLTCQ